jgi:hypothetical protein
MLKFRAIGEDPAVTGLGSLVIGAIRVGDTGGSPGTGDDNHGKRLFSRTALCFAAHAKYQEDAFVFTRAACRPRFLEVFDRKYECEK